MSRLKQLGKDSVVYGIGGAIGKGISFFLLPVYTRIFTPADYGTIEMMTVIVNLLVAFLVMGMDSAQSFYFFEQKKNGKAAQATVVSAILQWRLSWGLGMVIIAGVLAPLLNAWLFDSRLSWLHFGICFAGALFYTVMSQSIEIFRLLYRPWPYVGVTILHTAIAATLVLLLVLGFGQGILGFFLGSSIASLMMAIYGWYLARDYLELSTWHSAWWPRLFRFGAPLLPGGLAFYGMSTADRWFIQHYHGETALGIYAVAAKFSLIMALGIETFRKAWWPLAMDAMHAHDGQETFRMIARLFMGLGVAAVVYLAFLAPWLVRWLAGPAFQEAFPIVGILAWQALFYGFMLIGAAGLWKAEKTHISALLMALSSGLSLVLHYLWVPEYGGMGAALATVTSYFIWIVLSLLISERYWHIDFPIKILAGQIGIGSLTVAAITWMPMSFAQTAILTHIAVMLLIFSAAPRNFWKTCFKG